MLKSILIVGAGSFLGGALRYIIGRLFGSVSGFPAATFLVNILGCFLLGLFCAIAEKHNLLSGDAKLFLATGFCGGFTTFSTFMNESFGMVRDNAFGLMLIYIGASIFAGMLMVYLGYLSGAKFFS